MLGLFGSKVVFHDNVLFVKLDKDLLDVIMVLRYHSLFRYDVLVDIVGVDLGNGVYGVRFVLRSSRFNSVLLVSCVVDSEVSSSMY